MDVETMREGQRRAGLHVVVVIGSIDRGLVLIGCQDHHDIGPGGSFGVAQHLEAGAFGLDGGGAAGTKRDRDILDAAVAQVLRMGMALAAIADDDDLLVLDQLQIAVGIIINAHVLSPFPNLFVPPAKAGIPLKGAKAGPPPARG